MKSPKPRIVIKVSDYRHNSGGVRVMHRLCHELNERGADCCVNSEKTNPDWNCKTIRNPDIDLDNDIIIYGDRSKSNELNAKKFVQYLLHFPENWGFEAKTITDNYYLYSQLLRKGRYAGGKMLAVDAIEDFYNDKNTNNVFNREYDCVWFGKYKGVNGDEIKNIQSHIESNSVLNEKFPIKEITAEFPSSREGVAELLRGCRYFYCYDDYTLLLYEALLCGAIPILMDNTNFDKSDYDKTFIGAKYIAFGMSHEEIKKAYRNLPMFRHRYYDYKSYCEITIDQFWEDLQDL